MYWIGDGSIGPIPAFTAGVGKGGFGSHRHEEKKGKEEKKMKIIKFRGNGNHQGLGRITERQDDAIRPLSFWS